MWFHIGGIAGVGHHSCATVVTIGVEVSKGENIVWFFLPP